MSSVLRLRVGSSALRATAVRGDAVTWAGEATYVDATELSDAVARLAAEAPRACRRLAVELERPLVQLRTIPDLPPVKRHHLVALVAQQAGRFFRKNGEPLVTDATWVGKSAPGVARVAAVEGALVDAIAVGARAAGLWLETISPAGEPDSLALLPSSERERRERLAHRRTRRLTLATCAVWLAAGGLFAGRVAWERRVVDRELAALRQPLAAVVEARRELRDAAATLDAITAAERDRGRGLATLAAITSAMPDSSVLTSFAWNANGTGSLVGAAKHATDVVARLDRLGSLPGVHLSGPALREAVAGEDWQRFTILWGDDSRGTGGS